MLAPDRQPSWLILRAQSGDRKAWDALLTFTQPWLLRYLRRLLGRKAGAADLAQETSLIIYRKLYLLQDPRAYRAWVYRIATREAHRRLRRRVNHASLDQWTIDDGVPLSAAVSADTAGLEGVIRECAASETQDDDAAEIFEAISKISSNNRAVLILHYFEGLSLRDVANILGIPTGTAKSRLSNALARMRDALAGQ